MSLTDYLNQKTVVITGAASGMGFACAKLFTTLGASVALLDVNQTKLDKALSELQTNNNSVVGFKADVTDPNTINDIFVNIKQKFSQDIAAVINCAGIADAQKILPKEDVHSLDLFQKVININLIGTFNVLRIAAKYMAQNKHDDAVIINTASIAAYEGQIGQCAYSASKAGINGLTLPAARELAKHKIRVVTIAPGLINTPLFDNLNPKAIESLIEQTVFPKRLGHAKEFAKLAAHIIENQYLNGTVIRLDGAVRMQAK